MLAKEEHLESGHCPSPFIDMRLVQRVTYTTVTVIKYKQLQNRKSEIVDSIPRVIAFGANGAGWHVRLQKLPKGNQDHAEACRGGGK